MGEKVFKVNCDFCGSKIECPKNMLDSKTHSCFSCFQKVQGRLSELPPGKLHVDIKVEELKGKKPSDLAKMMMFDSPETGEEMSQEAG